MLFSKGSSPTVKDHVISRLRQSDRHHKHLSHTTCTTKLQLVNKLFKAKQSTKDMSCENKLIKLVFKKQREQCKSTICFLFLPLFFIYIFRIKTPRMKCMNVMQCKSQKQKEKHKNQRPMVTNGKTMKHKDHVKKTQLDRVFCIQNLLDAPRVFEFVFTLEWFPTPELE